MKIDEITLTSRKPIWIALSAFYLDTELDDTDFRHIASTILASPYTFDEVKRINKYEIFPVLQPNLMSPAGVWAGFDEEWLIHTILKSLKTRIIASVLFIELGYLAFGWMFKDYWRKTHKAYNELKRAN